LILTNHPNSLREIVDKAIAKSGGVSQPMIQVEMVPLMLDLVRRGVGYTVLPYCAIHEPFLARLVAAAPIRGLRVSWVIVTSKERALSSATRRFIECVRQQALSRVEDASWRTAKVATESTRAPSAARSPRAA
jgi:LysR family nitrogen assimilation transcriptional regulator